MKSKAAVSLFFLFLAQGIPICASAGEQRFLSAQDSAYTATLELESQWLDSITKMVDEIRWGSHGDELRESCPLCSHVADTSDKLRWFPIRIEWTDDADLLAFDPDVWAMVGERIYKMVSIVFVSRRGQRLDYVEVGSRLRLKPGRYVVGKLSDDENPNQAWGLVAFPRSRGLDPKKITDIRFTADTNARQLDKEKQATSTAR